VRTRAALFRGTDQPLRIAEVALAEPEADGVLIAMTAAGICGSDLHVIKGEWERPTPMVLGHEGAGRVEAVGDQVTSLTVGDPVIVSWAPSCQECGSCRRGRPAACSKLRAAISAGTLVDGTTGLSQDGLIVYRMTTVGAFADHVLVPERAAIKIPDGVPLEHAALLGCAALTGVGAVQNAARFEAGGSAVVIGAGAVGQFIVQGLRIAEASEIVAVDPTAQRREQALELGATAAVDPSDLRQLVRSRAEGFDYAFDAVGGATTARTAFDAVHNGGIGVLVGMGPPGQRLDLDPLDLITQEKTLIGSMYGSGEPKAMTERLLAYLADGRLQIESMIGDRFVLDQINDAVDSALDGKGGRALVTMRRSEPHLPGRNERSADAGRDCK
jgi:S-(hydroxymethyl)glutathione dehydrogenase/alcohol dehydrogenase